MRIARWYCFEGPILAAAQRYLADHGGGRLAVSLTGLDLNGLQTYLDAGTPLAVWVTIGYEEPKRGPVPWRLPDGSEYYPYINLHCVVLAGQDGGDFLVADPLKGWRRIPKAASCPSSGPRAAAPWHCSRPDERPSHPTRKRVDPPCPSCTINFTTMRTPRPAGPAGPIPPAAATP